MSDVATQFVRDHESLEDRALLSSITEIPIPHTTLTAKMEIIGRVRGVPRGTVTFTDGTTILGTAQFRGGKATLITSALPIGDDPIEACNSSNPPVPASRSAGATDV